MKKKLTAIALVVCMLAVMLVGASLAYFTDEDQVENTFTVGNVSIDLYENGGITDADGNVVQEAVENEQKGIAYEGLMPSYKIQKEPVIQNTSKTNAAYVRVAVVMNNLAEINDAIDEVYEEKDYTEAQIQEVYDNVFNGWGVNYTHDLRGGPEYTPRMWMTKRNGALEIDMAARIGNKDSNYYVFDTQNGFMSDAEENDPNHDGYDVVDGYYKNAVNANERVYVFYLKLGADEAYTLFNGLNVPADFTAEQMKMFEDLKISIYADAIQADGFNDTKDAADKVTEPAYVKAFKALEETHPLGWWN